MYLIDIINTDNEPNIIEQIIDSQDLKNTKKSKTMENYRTLNVMLEGKYVRLIAFKNDQTQGWDLKQCNVWFDKIDSNEIVDLFCSTDHEFEQFVTDAFDFINSESTYSNQSVYEIKILKSHIYHYKKSLNNI
jgi:hypothetical protein